MKAKSKLILALFFLLPATASVGQPTGAAAVFQAAVDSMPCKLIESRTPSCNDKTCSGWTEQCPFPNKARAKFQINASVRPLPAGNLSFSNQSEFIRRVESEIAKGNGRLIQLWPGVSAWRYNSADWINIMEWVEGNYYMTVTGNILSHGEAIDYANATEPFMSRIASAMHQAIPPTGGETGQTGNALQNSGERQECQAFLQIPQNLKPGDILSPAARVSLGDKEVQGAVQKSWYINGKPKSSVIWDGKQTRIELLLSCNGRGSRFTAILPAYTDTSSLPGLASIGPIPGPNSTIEAVVGALAPGMLSVLAGLWGGRPNKKQDMPDLEDWKNVHLKNQKDLDDYRQHNAVPNAALQNQQSPQLKATAAKNDLPDEISRIQKAALKHGLWNPGGPGDAVGLCKQMLKDIASGKAIDPKKLGALRVYVADHIKGKNTDSIAQGQTSTLDIAYDGLQGTVRETLTGKDASGHFTLAGSVASLLGRLSAGIASGGLSETVYVSTNMLYAQNDAANRGASDMEIFKAGFSTGLIEAAPTVLGGMAMHYLPKAFPNVAQGIEEMMNPVKDTITELDSAIQKGSQSLANRLNRIINPMSDPLAATRAAVDQVLASSKPQDIVRLYSNGGMDRLAKLQAAGHISQDEARLLNARLAKQVNGDIDSAIKKTIDRFEKDMGIKIDETLLGDSGSTARPGGNPKAKTDFDRTAVTQFDQTSLAKYAKNKGITIEDAKQELQQTFSDCLSDNVDNQLRAHGFSRGASDLDYKTYTGIGDSAGLIKQPDAYPPGYTAVRQAVQGKGTLYQRGSGNEIVSRNISGQAIVDQHHLNSIGQLDQNGQLIKELPADPSKFNPDEFKSFSQQQLISATDHKDLKSIGKAMGREKDLANLIDHMAANNYQAGQLKNAGIPKPAGMDPELIAIADQINKNLNKAMKILNANLDANGTPYTESSFCQAVKHEIEKFHAAIMKG